MGLYIGQSDLHCIVDLFSQISIAKKIDFQLPPSLVDQSHLQSMCDDARSRTKDPDIPDSRMIKSHFSIGFQRIEIESITSSLTWADEQIRIAKRHARYKPGKLWESRKELQYINSMWPRFHRHYKGPDAIAITFPRDDDDEDDEDDNNGPNIFTCTGTNRAYKAWLDEEL